MKANSIKVALLLAPALSFSAHAAGNPLGKIPFLGQDLLNPAGTLGALTSLTGVLNVQPGTLKALSQDLGPTLKNLTAGGVNTLATLPGLSGLPQLSGTSQTLTGLERIPVVGVVGSAVISGAPQLLPTLAKSVASDLKLP